MARGRTRRSRRFPFGSRGQKGRSQGTHEVPIAAGPSNPSIRRAGFGLPVRHRRPFPADRGPNPARQTLYNPTKILSYTISLILDAGMGRSRPSAHAAADDRAPNALRSPGRSDRRRPGTASPPGRAASSPWIPPRRGRIPTPATSSTRRRDRPGRDGTAASAPAARPDRPGRPDQVHWVRFGTPTPGNPMYPPG
jgi:hypothetical protein